MLLVNVVLLLSSSIIHHSGLFQIASSCCNTNVVSCIIIHYFIIHCIALYLPQLFHYRRIILHHCPSFTIPIVAITYCLHCCLSLININNCWCCCCHHHWSSKPPIPYPIIKDTLYIPPISAFNNLLHTLLILQPTSVSLLWASNTVTAVRDIYIVGR